MLCSSMTGRNIVFPAVPQNTSIHRFEMAIKPSELTQGCKEHFLAIITCICVR